MSKADQNKYIRGVMGDLKREARGARHNWRAEDMPPTVQAAQMRLEAAQTVVRRWEDRRRKKSEELADKMWADFRAIERARAFGTNEETMRRIDAYVKLYKLKGKIDI